MQKLKFDSIWLTDHPEPPNVSYGSIFETLTILSSLVVETKLRLGTMKMSYAYRHPSVLAKMAATLDQISRGRVELGIGTGARPQEDEMRRMGIDYPKTAVRIQQLIEHVYMLKILWAKGKVSFNGKCYRLAEARANTPPCPKSIPIWTGAKQPRLLKALGRSADAWNFLAHSIKEYENALRIVKEGLREAGRKTIRSSIFSGTDAARNEDESKKQVERAARARNLTIEEYYKKSDSMTHGTPS